MDGGQIISILQAKLWKQACLDLSFATFIVGFGDHSEQRTMWHIETHNPLARRFSCMPATPLASSAMDVNSLVVSEDLPGEAQHEDLFAGPEVRRHGSQLMSLAVHARHCV